MYNNNSEFRSMKRAHSPDNSFEGNNFRGGYNQHNNFRNYPQQQHPGGYHHPFAKRHRGAYNNHGNNYEPPPSLEDQISRLGDTGSHNGEIGKLAREIDKELANKSKEEETIKLVTTQICKSIISFPTRIATYATLIGLISVKNYHVSCQIIQTLQTSYPLYLKAQKWSEALTIMHLLACLVNCKVIGPVSLISQFEYLLEVANENDCPQKRSDYFVYTILSSLPYVARELSNQEPEPNNFEQLLNNVEAYLNKRSKSHLKAIRVWQSNDQTVQMDYLDSLWVQVKNFRANGWIETFLHKPYNDKEYKDTMASSLILQNSPTIQVPAHSSDNIYPNPKIVLRVFDDDVTEGHNRSIPGQDKIERFCIENHIRRIIDEIPIDAKVCVRHLSHMYNNNQLPMKHLLIETILGELFALPKAKHQEIFYQVLLYELTKIYLASSKNPDDIKTNYDTILNEAVKLLYNNLETMNVSCFTKFVEWFSFHLNNTEFLYPWTTWMDATQDATKSGRKALFVQQILERLVRFSFYTKIQTMVSVSLPDLMPPQVEVKYNPVFIDDPNTEQIAATIKKLIFEKADGKTICETLNIIIDGVEMNEGFTPKSESLHEKMLKIDIFTAVIISIASKSLTHLSSAIGKYRNVFKALIIEEGGQLQLLTTMHSCIANHPQLAIILVDKLLKAELIDAKEVCKWLFSDSMKSFYLKSHPWEILNNTTNRLMQITNKLIKERDQSAKEASEKEIELAKKKAEEKEERTNVEADNDEDEELDEPKVKEEKIDSNEQSAEISQATGTTTTETADVKPARSEDVQMNVDATEPAIDYEGKIEQARTNFHDLLVLIFTLFSNSLSEHMRRSESNGLDHRDSWFCWIEGRMRQVYYNHYDTIQSHDDILKIIMNFL